MADLHAKQTPPSLLLRIRNIQDAESWQMFVSVYAPLVYRYCRRLRLQDADATDVTQEVLAQVARSIRTFEYQPERGRFRDWLGTVTRNKLRRFLEKQGRQVRGKGGADSNDALNGLATQEPDSDWSAQFNAHVLRIALERVRPHFEPATWQAFEGTWLNNRGAADVARELGQPLTMVYVSRSRVLKRLRKEVLLLSEDAAVVFA